MSKGVEHDADSTRDGDPTVPPASPAGGREPTDLGEVLLRRQRDDWLHGQRVRVEIYLGQYPELMSEEETLLDLIYHEYVLRQELGDRPRAEEYFERFPLHRESLRRQLGWTGR